MIPKKLNIGMERVDIINVIKIVAVSAKYIVKNVQVQLIVWLVSLAIIYLTMHVNDANAD